MPSDLEQIEEYAALFLTIDEIAILLNTNAESLRREIKGQHTERAKAYLRGKLQTVIELRRQTLQFAKKGSPQAEAAMLEALAKQNLSENA
jgi:IS30 family transposase